MTMADLIEKVQAAHGDLSKRQVAHVVDAVFEHLARGSHELVSLAVKSARAAGRGPASPDEARRLLGLR